MLTIISPAKNMAGGQASPLPLTRPRFLDQAGTLAGLLREYSPWQLESLMSINPQLALGAYGSFQAFDPGAPGSPALLSYRGLQYLNIRPEEFTSGDMAFAQEHLRVLSAFYGLLRPLDGIQPYRLELQCKVKVQGRSLYAFWGDTIYKALFSAHEPVVNLASGEYSKAVSRWAGPADRFITCDFLTRRKGKLLTLPTFAKMARGQMARFMVKERVDRPEGLREFYGNGYRFSGSRSTESRYVFLQED